MVPPRAQKAVIMVTRRQLNLGLGAIFEAATVMSPAHATQTHAVPWPQQLTRRFAEIEARCGGRLGVGILDTQAGRTAGHRANERSLCAAPTRRSAPLPY